MGPPMGWWPCYFVCLFFILVYFYDTHQVRVWLPNEVGGLAVLF
jgi:hypothetical protein